MGLKHYAEQATTYKTTSLSRLGLIQDMFTARVGGKDQSSTTISYNGEVSSTIKIEN